MPIVWDDEEPTPGGFVPDTTNAAGQFVPDEAIAKPKRVLSYTEAAQPRLQALQENASVPQTVAAGTADAFSFVGRALVAATKVGINDVKELMLGGEEKKQFKASTGKDWDEFKTELAKTEAAQGGVSGLIENILRDPATVATLPIAAAKGAGIAAKLLTGAEQGAASAAAHQTDKFSQTGKVDIAGAAGETAMGAAMGLTGGLGEKLLNKITAAPKEIGDQLMQEYLHPPRKIFDDGFDIQNVRKYQLYGKDKEEITQNANAKLKSLFSEVQNRLTKAGDEGATVNVADALGDAILEIKNNKTDFASLFLPSNVKGSAREAIESMPINNAADKVAMMLQQITNGNPEAVNALTANEIRQALGNLASKAFNQPTLDDNAVEALAAKTYNNIKKQLSDSKFGNIQELNDQISEIIPIRNAAQRGMYNEAVGQKSIKDRLIGLFATKPQVIKAMGLMETPAKVANKAVKAITYPVPLASRTALFKPQDDME